MSIRKQTLWSMLPLLIVTVLNVGSVPLFYRYLGAENYALWFYVLTFSGAFGFMDLGLGVAVGRFVGLALGKGDSVAVREYWGTGNAIMIPLLGFLTAVALILAVFIAPGWFNVSPDRISLLKACLILGASGLFVNFYSQFWLILSQTHLDFGFLAVVRTLASVMQIAPSILLAKLTGSPLVLIAWSALISAVLLAVFILHARHHYHLGLGLCHASWTRAREMAAYTGKTFATLLTNSLLGSADRLLLGNLAPPSAFANYAIAMNVGGRVQALSSAVMGPVFSNTNRALGRGSASDVADLYNQTFAFTFPSYLLLTAWMAVWHPLVLRIWLGPELGSQVSPLLIPVLIGCSLTALSNISSAQLGSLNRVGLIVLFTIASGLLLMVGAWVGWHLAGVRGVAWAFLISRAAMVAQDLTVIRMIGAGGWLSSETWRQLAGQVVVAGLFSTVYLWLPAGSPILLAFAALHGLIATTLILRVTIMGRIAEMRWGRKAAARVGNLSAEEQR